jgi:glycosyltransferase involved in cell wall biosynthesis
MNQLVSIIVPTYNRAELIRKSVESLSQQTYPNIEIIIVDDGSSDHTKDIIKELQISDNRIQYFYQDNKGIAAARNFGIQKSCGDFIAFLDSDDCSYPDRIEKQIELLFKHPEIGIVGGGVTVVNKQNEVLEVSCLPEYPLEINWYVPLRSPFFQSTVILRREVLEGIKQPYDSNFKVSQDYDLWARLLSKTKGMNIQEPLVYYLFHNQGIGKVFPEEQWINHLDISTKLIECVYPEINIDKNVVSNLLILLWGYKPVSTVKREDIRPSLRKYLDLLAIFITKNVESDVDQLNRIINETYIFLIKRFVILAIKGIIIPGIWIDLIKYVQKIRKALRKII